MKPMANITLAGLAFILLSGCSSSPDEHEASVYDLTDQERFELVSKFSNHRHYIALKEIQKDTVGQVTTSVTTAEAEISSQRRYFDKSLAISQYCIDEQRKLDGFQTDEVGFTYPVYTITQDIVECPEWKLYKDLFAPHFENAKSHEQPIKQVEVN